MHKMWAHYDPTPCWYQQETDIILSKRYTLQRPLKYGIRHYMSSLFNFGL